VGIADDEGLLQKIHPAQENFRRAIQATAPNFVPFEREFGSTAVLPKFSFLSKEEGGGEEQDDKSTCSSPLTGPKSTCSSPLMDLSSLPEDQKKDLIYVDDVLHRAQRARTRELPGSYPFVVQKSFINKAIQNWQSPTERLCEDVNTIVTGHVKALIREHFADFGEGGLEQRTRILLQEHLRQCYNRAEERVKWLLEMEQEPFTLNTHYYADYRDKFLTHYKNAREQKSNQTLINAIDSYHLSTSPLGRTGISKILSGLADVGVYGSKPHDIPKILPPDKFEPALIIMAEVRAYFQVAYKRFSDIIPMAIDNELVFGLQRKVLTTLTTGLGLSGPDGHRICKELARESPQVAYRREELQKKLERLKVASNELAHVGI